MVGTSVYSFHFESLYFTEQVPACQSRSYPWIRPTEVLCTVCGLCVAPYIVHKLCIYHHRYTFRRLPIPCRRGEGGWTGFIGGPCPRPDTSSVRPPPLASRRLGPFTHFRTRTFGRPKSFTGPTAQNDQCFVLGMRHKILRGRQP